MTVLVRERAPTRLMVDVETPDGKHARWGIDEPDPADVPSGLSFSTTMPGGFEQLGVTLPRKPATDYPDLAEFSTLTVCGAGGEIAWQGRLETSPRTSGDQLAITPGAVGWQAALSDDNTARMIYIDCQQQNWHGPSVQRQLNLLASSISIEDPAGTDDWTTGQPALVTQVTSPWTNQHNSEAWYDAQGIPLGALYYGWKIGSTIDSANAGWNWQPVLSDDDVASSYDATPTRAAGPATGTRTATTATRKFASVLLSFNATSASSLAYPLYWTYLGVVGNHGLTIRGTLTTTGGIGVYASDAIGHAVNTWAPALATTFAGDSTITPTTFIIPQLAFTDPTSPAEIINQASRFDTSVWAVWDGPTFWYHPRGARGSSWRARVGPSGLQETGPQVDRIYNGVIVQYTDVSGVSRTVGPVGSGSNSEDATLADVDPTNPANEAGLRRWTQLTMGTSTVAGATQIGVNFLAEQRLLSTAGQAALVGHVEDNNGVLWPAWKVRAGDTITFVDAADPSPRQIVKTAYSDATRTCQIDLDSPPEGLSALLQRMGVVLAPLGLSLGTGFA